MKRGLSESLLAWMKSAHRKPLVLVGARQVGKTYLIQELGRTQFERIHSFNFEKDSTLHRIFQEDLSPQFLIQELSLRINRTIDAEKDLLFFDEVQACPRALTSLKYFCEEMPKAFICAAGSLLGVSLNETSFPVGKVEVLHVPPLSFEEFLGASPHSMLLDMFRSTSLKKPLSEEAHRQLWEQWKNYTIVGGLPEGVTAFFQEQSASLVEAFSRVRKYQNALLDHYESDMAKHSGKVNALHLQRIWRSVPAQLAKEVNGATKRFQFKGVVPGVSKYDRLASAIDWLHKAGLVLRVPLIESGRRPLMASQRENFFKLYVFDIGLLGALCQIAPAELRAISYGSYKGYFAENFVAQELTAKSESLFCWKEKESEVEFVIEKEGHVLPIEVKSGCITKAKSLAIFADKYNPVFRTIVSGKDMRYNSERRILHCPIPLISQFPLGLPLGV